MFFVIFSDDVSLIGDELRHTAGDNYIFSLIYVTKSTSSSQVFYLILLCVLLSY